MTTEQIEKKRASMMEDALAQAMQWQENYLTERRRLHDANVHIAQLLIERDKCEKVIRNLRYKIMCMERRN